MPGSSGGTDAEDGVAAADDESGSSSVRAMSGGAGYSWFCANNGGTKGWRLRGVEWRINLGVLPAGDVSVEAMRLATADGRRKYAELRRRLLVDPHVMDDDHFPHMMDNPLSLDPESVWGRYFRNDELGKVIEKDLMRLCPEHVTFFQSASCQAMMRRILLVWSLIHPQISYRQGMHELLAPLLYVLHVDVVRLSKVKGRFDNLFDDRFDSLSLQEQQARDEVEAAGDFCGEMVLCGDSINFHTSADATDEIGPDEDKRVDLSSIIKGCDMYGVEGELGALLSARFLEHDAYCMLDALLSGQNGVVSMADYFLPSSGGDRPPVIEASLSLYRILAAADSSLYTHLTGLGIEPQLFALRWLRLLFGREFIVEDLLRIWDAIFSADNSPSLEGNGSSGQGKVSQRGALIFSIAVSMLLYVRPALLAAPDMAFCLQRLFNFPRLPNVKDLIESAKSLQGLALATIKSPIPYVPRMPRSSDVKALTKTSRSGSVSPPASKRPRNLTPSPVDFVRPSMSLPGSYWEERWTHSVLRKKSLVPIFLSNSSLEESDSRASDSVERQGSPSGRRGISSSSRRVSNSSGESSGEDDDGQEMSSRGGAEVPASESPLKTDQVDSAASEAGSELTLRTSECDKELTNQPRLAENQCAGSSPSQEADGSSAGASPLIGFRGDVQVPGSETSARSNQVTRATDSRNGVDGSEIVCSVGSGLNDDLHISETDLASSDALEHSELPARSENSSHTGSATAGIINPRDGKNFEDEGSAAESKDFAMERRAEAGGKLSTSESLDKLVALSKPRAVLPQVRFRWLSWIWSLGKTSPVEKVIYPKLGKLEIEAITNKPHIRSGTIGNDFEASTPVVASSAPRRRKSWWRGNSDVVPEEQITSTSTACAEPIEAGNTSLEGSAEADPDTGNESCEVTINAHKEDEAAVEEGVQTEAEPCSDITDTPEGAARSSSNKTEKPEEVAGSSSSIPENPKESEGPCSETVEKPSEAAGPCSDIAGEPSDSAGCCPDIVEKPKEASTPSKLQAIGQSVLEHVQVLESALAQKVSGGLHIENVIGSQGARDRSECGKAGLGSVGQGAALAAIAELRKISHILQQM